MDECPRSERHDSVTSSLQFAACLPNTLSMLVGELQQTRHSDAPVPPNLDADGSIAATEAEVL